MHAINDSKNGKKTSSAQESTAPPSSRKKSSPLNKRENQKTRTRPSSHPEAPWTVEKSADLYQINGWGSSYFGVNQDGHVSVQPDPSNPCQISLFELSTSLKERGLGMPLLIRFPDIVRDRIRRLNHAFQSAISEYEYDGKYQGVFPVKVNQQSHLIEDIVSFGDEFDYGLEAGSKPELLIALSAMRRDNGLIICNGYKDRGYIETALLAQRLNKKVIIVLERLEEVHLAIEASKALGIRPLLGVRAKLTSKGVGRWAKSSGERAKFGLSHAEIIQLIDQLSEADMLDTLELLHFHIGSQISSIIPIKNALQEASNIYVELAKLGCSMKYLDVGGGLAIDYDGSKTDFHASKNYQLSEYAHDVVDSIQSACKKSDIPSPIIVTESGRAVAAHHSVLVFEVVDVNEVRYGDPQEPEKNAPRVLLELWETYQNIVPKNVQESFHDANQAKEESQSLFKYGYLGLREHAHAERLYWHCCERIRQKLKRLKHVPEELQDLERTLSAIYYCNFSVFQSAPDIWAIDQLFPIMPIHRLEEEPTNTCTLADLTCDSDGIVDRFIDLEDEREILDVHPLEKGKPYYLGMFLNGAYQEILGDLHNLFGDTNAAHVRLAGESYEVAHVVKGDSVNEVLRYVQYNPDDMVEHVRRQADRAVTAGRLENKQMRTLMKHYEDSLNGYTYLTD
ncbi:MAG: biosynthetic arginine decarboxylase [Polyangiaceae bacterium]|nr:biosynthetic arginine decarboxylase [Polyangiaceae bacterium]